METNEPIKVADICDLLGRKAIAEAVNVRTTAVSNAVAVNCFPSKWYLIIKAMCDARNHSCPSELFSFERAADAAPAADVDKQSGAAA